MADWLKRMSATAAGRLAAAAVLGSAGISALAVDSWQYIVDAPWVFQLLTVGLLMVLFAIAVGGVVLFMQTPAQGICTPRFLRLYKLPLRKLSWNFDNYLGMTCGQGSPVIVHSFQARFRINLGKGIRPLRAFMDSRRSGTSQDVLIECGNPYLRAQDIKFLPKGKWYQCHAHFAKDGPGDHSEGMTKETFLRKFPDFIFVFEYEGGKFERQFDCSELELVLDHFWKQSNPLPELKPTLRAG